MGAHSSKANEHKGAMSRMIMMVPVMFMCSKLDWENESLVQLVRQAYYVEQLTLLVACGLLYLKISDSGPKQSTKIWVKNPPSPSNPKPKWQSTTYKTFELHALQQLASQIVMGVAMTSFLHFKWKIKQSMVMQAMMMPLTFIDAPVVKRHFLGDERAHGEKLEGEERPEDKDEDDDGESDDSSNEKDDSRKNLDNSTESTSASKSEETSSKDRGEDNAENDDDEPPEALDPEVEKVAALIGEAWDDGKEAKYEPLLKALTPALVNTKSDSEATALMVIAAGNNDVSKYVRKVLALGADPTICDDEGWTALHWATYHTNVSGVTTLCDVVAGSLCKKMLESTDDAGETALDLARRELSNSEEELKELEKEKKKEEDEDDEADPLTMDAFQRKSEEVKSKTSIVTILAKATGDSASADDFELVSARNEASPDMQEID